MALSGFGDVEDGLGEMLQMQSGIQMMNRHSCEWTNGSKRRFHRHGEADENRAFWRGTRV